MAEQYQTKTSGKGMDQYQTGAQRDSAANKGRYDLIPPEATKRVAGLYERGAIKYEPRNWEKGIPADRCLDSALRHAQQALDNYNRRLRGEEVTDPEDHLAAVAFNVNCLMAYEERGMIDRFIGKQSAKTQATRMFRQALIYISGPMTNGGKALDWTSIGWAVQSGIFLMSKGYAVLMPQLTAYAKVAYSHGPKLDWRLWPENVSSMNCGLDHTSWIRMDKTLIEKCDAVRRIPGPSVGADEEVAHAKSLGIPVFDYNQDVIDNIPAQIEVTNAPRTQGQSEVW